MSNRQTKARNDRTAGRHLRRLEATPAGRGVIADMPTATWKRLDKADRGTGRRVAGNTVRNSGR